MVVRALTTLASSGFAAQPHAHTTLQGLSSVAIGNRLYLFEQQLDLFALPALSNPARVYTGFNDGSAQSPTTAPAAPITTTQPAMALPFRLLYDVVKSEPAHEAKHQSKNRAWIVSAPAALHLLVSLLSQPIPLHTQPHPPIVTHLAAAVNALFAAVATSADRHAAPRLWAVALCRAAASALSDLPACDILHSCVEEPLSELASSLGRVARVRNERLAKELAALARAGQFDMATLSRVTPEAYMERYTERVSRSFLALQLCVSLQREQERMLPNLTTIQRERSRVTATATIMCEMLLRAANRQLTPPFSDAVGLDLYTDAYAFVVCVCVLVCLCACESQCDCFCVQFTARALWTYSPTSVWLCRERDRQRARAACRGQTAAPARVRRQRRDNGRQFSAERTHFEHG